MSVRAKFQCYSVKDYGNQKEVDLCAVSDKDGTNASWAKYTPSGSVKMTIDNPAAAEQFVPGRQYFVDFTAVEPEPAK